MPPVIGRDPGTQPAPNNRESWINSKRSRRLRIRAWRCEHRRHSRTLAFRIVDSRRHSKHSYLR